MMQCLIINRHYRAQIDFKIKVKKINTFGQLSQILISLATWHSQSEKEGRSVWEPLF